MSPIACHVVSDLSAPSRSFSAHRITLTVTEEPVTGELTGSGTVYNNRDSRSGVFASLGEALEAVRRVATVPFSVWRNALTGELVVRRVEAAPAEELVRVATVRADRGVTLHEVT